MLWKPCLYQIVCIIAELSWYNLFPFPRTPYRMQGVCQLINNELEDIETFGGLFGDCNEKLISYGKTNHEVDSNGFPDYKGNKPLICPYHVNHPHLTNPKNGHQPKTCSIEPVLKTTYVYDWKPVIEPDSKVGYIVSLEGITKFENHHLKCGSHTFYQMDTGKCAMYHRQDNVDCSAFDHLAVEDETVFAINDKIGLSMHMVANLHWYYGQDKFAGRPRRM